MLELRNVKALVDNLGNGFDFGAEFGFNFVQGESVVVGDQVDCHTEMAEPSGPTDSVQVGLRHLGEVEVDDNIDSLDVNTAGQQVGTHQVPAKTGSEVVEDAVPVVLRHPGVNVVAAVAEVSDLLG